MSNIKDKNSSLNKNLRQNITRNTVKKYPELKEQIVPPLAAFSKSRKTPRSPQQNLSFNFDNNNSNLEAIPSTSYQSDSLLDDLNFDNSQNTPFYHTPTDNFTFPQENLEKENLIEFENKNLKIQLENMNHNTYRNYSNINMANQDQRYLSPSRFSMNYKAIENLIPEFDNKSISVLEFEKKVNLAKKNIHPNDEIFFVPLVINKLKGEFYNCLSEIEFNTIDELMTQLKQICPIRDTYLSAYANLAKIVQSADENVLSLANKIKNQANYILELYKVQQKPNEQELTNFRNRLSNDAMSYFKQGLKTEIQFLLGNPCDITEAIKSAIQIENKLQRTEELRKESFLKLETDDKAKSINFTQYDNFEISICQICRNFNHEALTCTTAACAYCRSNTHSSIDCDKARKKFSLWCFFCSKFGHTKSNCKLNKSRAVFCQFCQDLGHESTLCPFIKEFQFCWKCNEEPHDPKLCKKIDKIQGTNNICQNCDSSEHRTQNCPQLICSRCNRKGHSIKFCNLSKETANYINEFCFICQSDDHSTKNCETSKILFNQVNNTKKNNIKCQICSGNHSAKFCNLYNSEQQSNSNISCQICGKNHSAQNCYKYINQNQSQVQNQNSQIQIRNQNNQDKNCSFCRGNHETDDCLKLIDYNISQGIKVCKYCKQFNHVISECIKLQRKNQGNFIVPQITDELEER